MENLDQESKSQSQPEIFIFSEPRFLTGRNCLEEGKFTASYFFMAIFSLECTPPALFPYPFETLRNQNILYY